jgi:2,4-dienoyl-CoA reductase (NADPH2)
MIARYATATRICRDAGFDGIEPHGAHGFLLNRFFSPAHNPRTDAYGGSLENRMRLALEIVRAVREAAGEDLLLLYRHTPVTEGSYGLDDSLVLARRLVDAGVDILDISPCGETPGELAKPFRAFGVPVIAVGNLDIPDRAAEVLRGERADLIAVGRALIADPDWPLKARAGRWEAITRCVRCNEKCFGNLRRNEPIACTRWNNEVEP